MIKIDSLSLKFMPPKKIELLEKLQKHLEVQNINVIRISPWANKIEIFIAALGKKRHIIEVYGFEHYMRCGEESYFLYVDQEIKNKFSEIVTKQNEVENQNKLDLAAVLKFIYNNDYLRSLNSQRSRNFILYRNGLMDLVYDIRNKELFFDSKHPFSSIEHDTNRKFTERICIDILLDYEKSKQKFIKLLSKPYDHGYAPMYQKYIDIINGDSKSYTEDDIFVMISILGRLLQEKEMGPISVRVDDKLNPDKVVLHDSTKKYVHSCLVTIKEYTQFYLLNKEEMKPIGNIGFNEKLDNPKLSSSSVPLLINVSEMKNSNEVEINKLRKRDREKETYQDIDLSGLDFTRLPEPIDRFKEPNYIESFFKLVIKIFEQKKQIPIVINNFKDIAGELLNYASRFSGNTNPDFIILAKMKGILTYYDFDSVIKSVDEDFNDSKRKFYYRVVAEHILGLNSKEQQKREIYSMLNIYETYIIKEISRFNTLKKDNKSTGYNDDEIAIVSDMHFNNLNDIYKGNFSKNFNILAGDFYNNTYHRGGIPITEALDISGIGVIGNHDVSWIDSVSDLQKEVNTNYRKTIKTLNKAFPNVKILNNEVYYKNNVAFVGLTMVTDETIIDEETKQRTFFANADLGDIFIKEDYIATARQLLDSVDKNIPIVLITHSPFKEYAVCKNKSIGIYSNSLFKGYPNIKVYIHGHGHSYQNSKLIDGILCITNPIVNNIYNESSYSINWNNIKEDMKF